MKRYIFLLVSIFLFTENGYAQTHLILGLVQDAETNEPLNRASIVLKGTSTGAMAREDGYYRLDIPQEDSLAVLVFSYVGYEPQEVEIQGKKVIDVKLRKQNETMEVTVVGYQVVMKKQITGAAISTVSYDMVSSGYSSRPAPPRRPHYEPMNTNDFNAIEDNNFKSVQNNPLSTFSSDVDKASYSIVRKFINGGFLPPKDAVRIEEMINYFDYSYDSPKGKDPVAIYTEVAICPWNEKHQLMKIGLQAQKIDKENLPPSNIVFLMDVSGSMYGPTRLDLVKSSFKMLTKELRPQDRVAIVVYSGAAGLVLPSTSGAEKETIIRALDQLTAGGSTAGGEGINLAYKIAQENFVTGGNNRVILATDGDFNVGASSDADMKRLIEEKRKSGVFLSVLGYGMGNYKDNKMETIADAGNGNYAYINDIAEANRVLVKEFGGTLFTVAKDVKLQVEFNPAYVQGYRLIGYENRLLNDEDFKDDKKDAGDMGAGHTVTALYELIPAGARSKWIKDVDPLKYQNNSTSRGSDNSEIANVKIRYKQPDGEESTPIEKSVSNSVLAFNQASEDFRFAASIASFGMLLRDSEFKQNTKYARTIDMAKASKGADEEGDRAEMIKLMQKARYMKDDRQEEVD